MRKAIREGWDAVKMTFSDFMKDHATRLSAALAFYTVFALAPMLVIVIAIAGRAFGEEAVRGQVVQQFGSLIGQGAAHQVEEMVAQASAPKTGLVASILGFITLFIGATGVFTQLKGALNQVWEVVPKKRSGLVSLLRDRALALAMLMGIAFLLLVSLILSAGLSAIGKWAEDLVPVPMAVLQVGNFLLSFLVVTFLFAMIYKILPDSRIAWKDVWVGAMATSFLFAIGKTLIGLYLGRSSLSSVYGAAGSFAILLTWIYYSAAIFLLGAEFTQVYSRKWGTRILMTAGSRSRAEELRAGDGNGGSGAMSESRLRPERRPERLSAVAQERDAPTAAATETAKKSEANPVGEGRKR